MKKILYIITQSELGGAQKNVFDLAAGLSSKYEVLVAAGRDKNDWLFTQLDKIGVKKIRLKWLRRSAANPLKDLLGLWEIRQLLKKERPDILHLHSSKAGVLGSLAACCLPNIKVVYTVHGAVFEASFSPLIKKLFLWLEKITARLKDKIICVSANDKKLWLKYQAAPDNKLMVIHNGLAFKKEAPSKSQAREKFFGASPALFEAAKGSSQNLKIVGTVANFYPEKGLPYLIEAANIIINEKKFENIIFVIMGDGPERPLLEEIIKEYQLGNNFILAGRIDSAHQYLSALNVFVLPSVKEGLPYTILEAMAAGLPIVASKIGGVHEMVKNEKNGFLIPPRDVAELADKIIKLLDDPALNTKFGQASKQKIQEFSLDKMIAATGKVYLEK